MNNKECEERWCKVDNKKHYHLHNKMVKIEEVWKGVTVCCLAKVHIEVTNGNGGRGLCGLACKKCGHGLSGGGVIIFPLTEAIQKINEPQSKKDTG